MDGALRTASQRRERKRRLMSALQGMEKGEGCNRRASAEQKSAKKFRRC